jgi:predicted HTH domain antitoxin
MGYGELIEFCWPLWNLGTLAATKSSTAVQSEARPTAVKLEVEIDIPGGAVDKAELQHRVRRETILSLLADRKLGLVQAANELGISRSSMITLLRERGKGISFDDLQINDDLEPVQTWTHRSVRDLDLLERARAEAASFTHAPTIEEVRSALASIPGSMSELVVAERGEY